jgi:hypothetical protein
MILPSNFVLKMQLVRGHNKYKHKLIKTLINFNVTKKYRTCAIQFKTVKIGKRCK